MNNDRIYQTYYISPIGKITLVASENHLIGLWLEGQKYYLNTINEKTFEKDDLEIFKQTKKWLDLYFDRKKPLLSDLSLAPRGTDFRKMVWKVLCDIPYGEVTTYGAVAKEVAKLMGKETMSSQAIGGAVGHNPIFIIIPCHRVIGSSGGLTGYAGGIDKKRQLLEIEEVNLNKMHILKRRHSYNGETK